jgi:hypothetical protein
LISTDRMKRIIAEENPMLLGYDETKFSKNLFYHEQPAADAVTMIDLNRRMFTNVLQMLPEAALKRPGVHSERGNQTLGGYLQGVVNHLDHHLKFIYSKREKMGKMMW